MKFTVATKPLCEAVGLGVVNANVSKFYKKSCLVQLTAYHSTLQVNIEAASISTEILFKGSSDEPDALATIFVDSLLFKQLIATIESPTVILEFLENSLTIHAGKSKMSLPKLVSSDDISLKRPDKVAEGAVTTKIDKTGWKFVKDYQMFALTMSFTKPVYMNVWLGGKGDVLASDFDNGLFTHSTKLSLGRDCMVPDTIVNLFNSLPDNAVISNEDDTFIISVDCDAYMYRTQFRPAYETDEGAGEYNADMILEMMNHSDEAIRVSPTDIGKVLNQAQLLSNASDSVISFGVENGKCILSDANILSEIECRIDSQIPEFMLPVKTDMFKSVVSKYDDTDLKMAPMIQEDEVVGIAFWDDNMSTVLAGVE